MQCRAIKAEHTGYTYERMYYETERLQISTMLSIYRAVHVLLNKRTAELDKVTMLNGKLHETVQGLEP